MYFVTYLENNVEKVGLLLDNKTKVLDLARALGKNHLNNMLELITHCNKEMIDKIKGLTQDKMLYEKAVDVKDIKLYSPIPQPRRNVICLGLNYKDHAEELKNSLGKQVQTLKAPVYFGKMACDIIGDGDAIDNHPNITEAIDYEVELAVIIGKEGKNISLEEAEDYIFGYSILNDLSARDLQTKHTQWIKGKSLDTFTAMGPCIVHKSELPFPIELNLTCRVNDEVRQSSNTRNLIFDIPYIISDLSKGMTLKPGDIIATGTPAGVGMGFSPPKYLKSGDVITCSIEKIGELINKLK
ncbi:fumarylacetoacetate hydrolase family protein [Natronincola ferrireducens]|uniref:2-keto-4-pentenoate hydratase/2-oxohepta-3-ene-1,7-dioic acid hydratase (Catechol pathway) n=1 Tax=Natronincola ferrireducens TaxID=393762 RepID=A0A1G8ZK18_9FIRM|nr:fumarylacetoacetate hydrolase family protein [Natronincola ferrireducens]SDK15416.1 2-keto-4-pentenoate hydratase/2-oxohepta-3-ene-1,7-dioic acid hydratase (catechol pathway) [Natronincola ferrireducens]